MCVRTCGMCGVVHGVCGLMWYVYVGGYGVYMYVYVCVVCVCICM